MLDVRSRTRSTEQDVGESKVAPSSVVAASATNVTIRRKMQRNDLIFTIKGA